MDVRIMERQESRNLRGLLERARRILESLGSDFHADGEKIKPLADRLAEERFQLAVLGQFKRGKSSVLNALLGSPVLPTAVVPLTAIPTLLRFGSHRAVRVFGKDGTLVEEAHPRGSQDLQVFLARYVTEEQNPENRLGVSRVEVEYPAPLLRRGVILVDTPGIGSTFRHNTETTLGFLPESDAALFVLSTDPPITAVEVEFLREVRSRVSRLFFVLNKVDYLSERERRETLEFLRRTLQRELGLENPRIFALSARQGLAARESGDSSFWARSGMADLERFLTDFLAREKTEALREAVAQKARGFLGDAVMRIRLTIKAHRMPLKDLQQKIQLFEKKLGDVRHEQRVAGDLLLGDKKRAAEHVEEQASRLRDEARRHLEEVVRRALAGGFAGKRGEAAVQAALAETVPDFFDTRLNEMSRSLERRVAEVLWPHQARLDRLVETVRRAATDLFEVPYSSLEGSKTFEMRRQPYWVTYKYNTSMNQLTGNLADRLLPGSLRQARLEKKLTQQVEALVALNVENLRWAALQNIDDAFRRFGRLLEDRLEQAITGIQAAVQTAVGSRAQKSVDIKNTVSHLESAASELENLQKELAAP